MIKFVDVIPENESVGVCVLLIDKWTDNIYLAERKGEYEKGKYCVPGGMVELNETYIDGLIREIKEETGIQLKIPGIQFVDIAEHSGAKSNYTMWFKYYLNSNEIPINLELEKHSAWTLFSKDQALKLPLMLSTTETILKHL